MPVVREHAAARWLPYLNYTTDILCPVGGTATGGIIGQTALVDIYS